MHTCNHTQRLRVDQVKQPHTQLRQNNYTLFTLDPAEYDTISTSRLTTLYTRHAQASHIIFTLDRELTYNTLTTLEPKHP